jgi:hypothetical protein
MVLPGLAIVLTLSVPDVLAQQAAPAAQRSVRPAFPSTEAVVASLAAPVDQLAGVWVYNEAESLNAATGRQERSPRSATQRTPVGRGIGAGTAGRATFTPPPSAADSGRSNVGPRVAPGLSGQLGPTVAMIQENRSLTRDLLEVPESLTISAEPGQVTFVDDLLRERSYQTTGEKARYQLGAARFNAAAEWNGNQLVKKIDGADGFRMTETYFLSEDGNRLFVIVRVGSDRKGAPIMGVNRVYDRVDP